MSADPARSEEVIAGYKRHKLAHSALHRIHALIRDFDRDAAFDRKLALIGVAAIALIVVVSLVVLFSGDATILG